MGWLVGVNGSVRGEAYSLRMGRNVIGRDRRSDVVVNDDQASSHHADLVFPNIHGINPADGKFYIVGIGPLGGGWGAKTGRRRP